MFCYQVVLVFLSVNPPEGSCGEWLRIPLFRKEHHIYGRDEHSQPQTKKQLYLPTQKHAHATSEF